MKPVIVAMALLAPLAVLAQGIEPDNIRRAKVPAPPWPQGDERGMANQIGAATWGRCAYHLALAGAQSYELSQV